MIGLLRGGPFDGERLSPQSEETPAAGYTERVSISGMCTRERSTRRPGIASSSFRRSGGEKHDEQRHSAGDN